MTNPLPVMSGSVFSAEVPAKQALNPGISGMPAVKVTPMEYRAKDMELYHQWKESKSKRHLGQLVDQLSPVIYQEVHRASGSLPTAALTAEAKKWTAKAIETFDPTKGVLLSTHVANYLPKVRRLNYKYQNAVRLPENLQLKYHEYTKAVTDLTEELNRDPDEAELANKLGWSKGHVVKFKNSLYADHIESVNERPSEFTHFNEGAILMEHLMSQLSDQEKFILEHSKDYSVKEMCEKLGMNTNRYHYLKKLTVEKIKKLQKEVGLT